MAHGVVCTICGARFDRDKYEYVITGNRRYAHATCMLREAAKDPNYKKLEIINPLDNVICVVCKKPLHRVNDPCVLLSPGKYAHVECAEVEKNREKTDKERLDEYIKKLYKTEYVNPLIQRQIKQYIDDYNFTYSGILKALQYFYEIKGNPISKAHGGIGIVPYIYKDAYNYHYKLWLAQQHNAQNEVIQTYYEPKVKEITIPRPQPKIKKRQLFTFLDEEVENGK